MSKKVTRGTFYLMGMAHHDSVLQSYRMIFIGLEAILFGFALALMELDTGIWAQWIVAVAGIICGVSWILVCGHRGKLVWRWRAKLLTTVRGIEEGRFLKRIWKIETKNGKMTKMTDVHFIARILFNWVLPIILIVGWGALIWFCLIKGC